MDIEDTIPRKKRKMSKECCGESNHELTRVTQTEEKSRKRRSNRISQGCESCESKTEKPLVLTKKEVCSPSDADKDCNDQEIQRTTEDIAVSNDSLGKLRRGPLIRYDQEQ
ncbi:uncharacterized protein LOC110464782 [Mizuhopecten yessoensis]|uniref:uncharacterized protein LOC110464782 n=1 Tax=Mizuhopecten yessoensis TaxID=6573 RepID=UPI000B45ACAF|nr:uncharacterized protein LOC110464782 [Mizuhopecten yessoensis]